jgi:hypothetical protein
VCEEQANATKSEVREEEEKGRAGQGRAGQGSQERHSEAETDTHPETDTHVFWMGVISTSECMLDYYSVFCLKNM